MEPTGSHKAQQRRERGRLIVESARRMAEADGWDGVTTRRLANAIDYTQPVLYGHFPDGKPEIMKAVALQGFGELTSVMSSALAGAADDRLATLASAYLDYAAANPAVYQAMFVLPIAAGFATDHAAVELTTAFRAIAAALGSGWSDPEELETAAEVFWSSLHGLVTLEGAGRLRSSARRARVALLAEIFSPRRKGRRPPGPGLRPPRPAAGAT